MTDITELAQSLKAAAEKWQEAWGKYDKVEITIAEFIRAANQYESIVKDPANVIELVEALEKAQAQSSKWLEAYHKAVSIGARYEERIAELESRTVKLPKPISVLHRREFTAAHCAIYAYPEAEVNAALDGAGIKWEAE